MPYSLIYETESVIPVKIRMPTFRILNFDKDNNETELRLNLDLIDKKGNELRCAKLPTSIKSPSTITRELSIGRSYSVT